MKGFNEYINEELKKHPKWCEIITNMFTFGGHSLTKEQISNMLQYLCSTEGMFKKYSDYLADTRPKEYLPYQPNDDDFLKIKGVEDGKKERDQIAEFIIKYIL